MRKTQGVSGAFRSDGRNTTRKRAEKTVSDHADRSLPWWYSEAHGRTASAIACGCDRPRASGDDVSRAKVAVNILARGLILWHYDPIEPRQFWSRPFFMLVPRYHSRSVGYCTEKLHQYRPTLVHFNEKFVLVCFLSSTTCYDTLRCNNLYFTCHSLDQYYKFWFLQHVRSFRIW